MTAYCAYQPSVCGGGCSSPGPRLCGAGRAKVLRPSRIITSWPCGAGERPSGRHVSLASASVMWQETKGQKGRSHKISPRFLQDFSKKDGETMQPESQLRFGAFQVDTRNACLWREEQVIKLTPKAFAVLCCLIEQAGQLVTKDELWNVVWPGI